MAHAAHGDREDDDRGCPVSRRAFLSGVAAAGGLALAPGIEAVAGASADTAVGRDYEYLYRSVGTDERVPTSIQVADAATIGEIDGVGTDFRSVTGPTPGAFARLTRAEAVEVYQTEGVDALRFAPGANPFWRLDEYPDRVFPASADAKDYVAFEEAQAGLEALATEYPDRMTVRSVGESPGHVDEVDGENERYDVTVVELTENVDDDASFAAKEKALYSIGIHGDERAGAEAGLRFIEDVLRGDEPEVEERLDEVALVFVLPNPDGWVSKSRLTDNGASDTFKRVTATGVDPNRQYPTVGWIDPSHNPAEPNGRNLADDDPGIDGDVEDTYTETVPDSLGVVEALREYENVAFGADFHGMFGSENMIEGLMMNDQYGVEEQAELDALNEAIDTLLDENLGPLLRENRDALERGADRRSPRTRGVPENPYNYGTILDTIGYTTTGGFGSWFADAIANGGVDAMGLSFEMALDNRTRGQMEFIPGLNEIQVVGYKTCMRIMAVQSARSIDGSIRANGRSTAYVGTDELTRSSASLSTDSATSVSDDSVTVTADESGRTVRLDVPAAEPSLRVSVRPETGDRVTARLRAADGSVERTTTAAAGGLQSGTTLGVGAATADEWTLELRADRPTKTTVTVTTVDATGAPDPVPALGYEQRPYEVSPLSYLDAYGDALAGEDTTRESVAAVASGALIEGGDPAVENLVVVHDDGLGDRDYLRAIEEFVAAGGDLVLTDTGVNLLAALSVDGADAIDRGDVRETTAAAATLSDKRGGRLLENVRPIEREIWKAPPLGYRTRGEAPSTLVDAAAFERAGGSVAATQAGDVILGELDGITVIGSLLPPASQENLHPFGLYEWSLSNMGQQLLVNALGHEQPGASGGDLR